MLNRAYYSDGIDAFLASAPDEVIGKLALRNDFSLEQSQRAAWLEEIRILQEILPGRSGSIYFEYSIPRMGQRIDVVLLIGAVIFVLEFKVGEREFRAAALDQVCDYALDLKNFHETSHQRFVAPILIATEATSADIGLVLDPQRAKLFFPIKTNPASLRSMISLVMEAAEGEAIECQAWEKGCYRPTPTIVEAAIALYNNHSVEEISRSDAGAINLNETSHAISEIIASSKARSEKAICFVTGVPGAGKTLVGLNIATSHNDRQNDLYSVFLSGNGPLVAVLREALARDKYRRIKEASGKARKGELASEVKVFIQNVHHFRDDCLVDSNRAPVEHVALFDEAQRAWNLEQTSGFMRRKKNVPNFEQSEPEFLISCLDRHPDWAVVVCLVGGGQEINTGEAGIEEWINALLKSFPDWHIYISPNLTDSEYGAGDALRRLEGRKQVFLAPELHLGVSMRSFRSENVSLFVKQILDLEEQAARETFSRVRENYQIALTRDISTAKQWLKEKARGSERYGIVVSSEAERLKPHAIDVRYPIDPVDWFLAGKEHVRSSYYLEDVATEFHVQGLELDWACVTWDADFRHTKKGWEHWSFVGSKWNRIKKEERKRYLKNAYRVLLTRARQGMIITVPYGDANDPTRDPEFYDATFDYLRGIGLGVV